MPAPAYYTTDTGELAPHPDITSDDLREFETWADEMDERGRAMLATVGAWSVALVVMILIVTLVPLFT